ncbi:uncharacterized protein LOC135713992 [Ochlerotatus camptorhynchus]|uniref:uncharacterized protein LOC135713992 n=1 Tax=Ochlerotatus camptorhynchus TaxID=644619 RepID=UPI0031D7F8F9
MEFMLRNIIISLLIFVFGLAKDICFCLQLTAVRIPEHVTKNSTVQLECTYDLNGEQLYSVKWYKDGNEFFRFVPRDNPPAQLFLLTGVSVDLLNSTANQIVLNNVTLASSGRYRCEVSAEAPSFQTVSSHGDMVVVALPDTDPKITGGRPRYQIGDTVRVNCTSGRSKPAAQLTWFINGDEAEVNALRPYNTVITGREGLQTTILGLEFRVRLRHFKRGDMKLKCIAKIAQLYWKSNEESVEGDKQPPALESKETLHPNGSRADRQESNSSSSNHRRRFMARVATNVLLSLVVLLNSLSSASALATVVLSPVLPRSSIGRR